jgi:hypothetical protein
MEGSWMAAEHQGHANVKKDRFGFWTMGFEHREDEKLQNPYAFPKTVSQVFFMDNTRNPSWKVVLRHEQ